MPTYKINLQEQTTTSINGIVSKMTEKSGVYEGVCLNPEAIPLDDLDHVILDKMIRESGIFYKVSWRGNMPNDRDENL